MIFSKIERRIKLLLTLLIMVTNTVIAQDSLPQQFIVVLGIAQDGGYPHIGCNKECCKAYWDGKESKKLVTALGVVDRTTNQTWLIEATPDIKYQLHLLQQYVPNKAQFLPDGIFMTHAHIGHYAGLMELGREALGSNKEAVYAMPRMKKYLETNGPWSQLVTLNNISIIDLHADSTVKLNEHISITPVVVPHRDEFSETVGYRIEAAGKKVLFIPDVNKWEKWDRDINAEVSKVDVALLDGTFYKNGELKRDMSEIPHPFVEESVSRFSKLSDTDINKVVFIHFNHTNPLIKAKSKEREDLIKQGFKAAYEGMIIGL